ncbi:MAG: sigma 54-interacting transcriptional regulator [Burkholderiales bacterium]|nr:sigma 54-interacting transcriptional regulator [Burkholderiales bacterium]
MVSRVNLAALLRSADGAPAQAASWNAGIVARSRAMQALLARAREAAASDVAVSIVGPAGSGKQTLARAIHRASARAAQPFAVLVCAHAGEAELRAALAGDPRPAGPRGAGAGTLYLEGIDALSPALQAALLETLEAQSPHAVRVRLISASREPLQTCVAAGLLREDLGYRLAIVRLVVPALAERREDIAPLVAHALARFAAQRRAQPPALEADALELLVAAPWPGNVRQLLATVEALAATAGADPITRARVEQALGEAPRLPTLDEARRAFERDYLERVLAIAGGSVTRAARLAGRNRTEFYRLLARHRLAPAAFKPPAAPRAGADDPAPR